MSIPSSATDLRLRPLLHSGPAWGALGVLVFSFTVPFTRVADGQLAPLFIGAGRDVVGGLLALTALAATRSRLPTRREWLRLVVTAGGVALGFPLLTSYSLARVPASHGAVILGLLPAATATVVTIRTGERPPRIFWVAAALGAVCAVGFACTESSGVGHLRIEDLLLIAAVVVGAIGYAEGGTLTRQLGAWQTISWALVVGLPVMTPLMALSVAHHVPSANASHWAAFAYLSVMSAYVGFFPWYHGLGLGPMAQVSQVQLIQPVLSIGWAALIVGEHVSVSTLGAALAVVGCATVAVRSRLPATSPAQRRYWRPPPGPPTSAPAASTGRLRR